jgi:hypothetical protein
MIKRLRDSIDRQMSWFERNGPTSLDQYDFWASRYGQFSKATYYKNRLIGGALVCPIFLLELLYPETRRFVAPRRRFPIADAHVILGHLNMHAVTGKISYLEMAETVGAALLQSSIRGYHGHCWGYPFDWMTTRGLWRAGTPLITTTPYCFEAFVGLHQVTGRKEYADVARSILRFAVEDLNVTKVGDGGLASSYSPMDHSKVMNASAYRAFVLVEGHRLFGDEVALRLGEQLLKFLLQSQQQDGSWLYGLDHPNDAFVDNFHTCFVLKNLYKCNRLLERQDLGDAIKSGHSFYARNLVRDGEVPKPFQKVGRVNLVAEEMYDYAEGISLGYLLERDVPGAGGIASRMLGRLLQRYQTEDGYFLTRVMRGGFSNKVPYLRWPQSQLYFALTNGLRFGTSDESVCVE